MNWKGKRVVVTGAAGFLGIHLCRALTSRGAQVTALDNMHLRSSDNMDMHRDAIAIINCDIVSDDLRIYTNHSDVVFHLAAIASPREAKRVFHQAFEVNVVGTNNVLRSCSDKQRIVYMSSASVYGDPIYVPMDENHPLNGEDPYAITKIMAEILCRNYNKNYGVNVVIVRNFNHFGPYQVSEYIIPTLIHQALNENRIEIWNAQPTRDFLYVDNTMDALLKIAATNELVGDVVNLGGGEEIQIGTLVQEISRLCGEVPIVDLGKDVIGSSRLVCDNRKLKETTGWDISVPFQEGLQRTVEWFKHATTD